MENQLWNKRNLTIGAVILVVVVVAVWFLYKPRTMASTMHHAKAEEGFSEETQMESVPDKNRPFVNPETGALLDGPGFEKGEIEGVSQEVRENIPSNYYFLDDGAGGEMSIQHNLCSKSCCSEQWPTPFKQKYDPYVCGSKDKFSAGGGNYFCSNSFQDSGLIARSE